MELFLKLRKEFLEFFKERGHTVVPSSSLVPDDPSVLLTTAGMQQFKRYYTGELNPMSDFGSARATSVQKCFRTSDIEEVGDQTHLTFFEMLGNFSFGPVGSDDPKDFNSKGYFKRSAIVWAYEFVTERLGINPERLYVTVFEGDENNNIPKDEEAYAIWYKEIGVPHERIRLGSREDNFWGPTGNEGPCGPTTEIYVAKSAQEALEGKGVEIWNVVFNEYYAKANETGGKAYTKVKSPGIDTGMGFERLLAVLQGVDSVFETSSFASLMAELQHIAPQLSERDLRVLADHIRSSIFLIADGIHPSNKEAGYILRRLLRRIIGLKIKNDIESDIFVMGYVLLKDQYGGIYSQITNEEEIMAVWHEENSKFQNAIAKGIKEIAKYETISGGDAFRIYETFGVPYDIIKELASASAVKNLSHEDFEAEFKKHQEISRAGAEKKFGGHGLLVNTGELKAANQEEMARVIRQHTATHLLQWALRLVLGGGVRQGGSDITSERLRFDFAFERKMTPEEISEVERLVNEKVSADLPVYYREMSKDEAQHEGALAFFREKYPDTVKVYYIGSSEREGVISKEFCGGPHVERTGEIGAFKIIKEESVGKGMRRIRATVE